MDIQLEALQDQFTELLELREEMAEELDADDPEVRALWAEMQSRMRLLRQGLKALQGVDDSDDVDIDELEVLVEEINDTFGELALLR